MVSSGINISGGGFAVLASQAINKTKNPAPFHRVKVNCSPRQTQ